MPHGNGMNREERERDVLASYGLPASIELIQGEKRDRRGFFKRKQFHKIQ